MEQKIIERGREFYTSISGESPSIFDKSWWTGKVMDWSMKNEDFKIQLFRFVDVLPYLNTSESLLRHIREYFADGGAEVPTVLRWGAGAAGFGGNLTAKLMGAAIRSNIEGMGRQFIVGQNVKEALGGIAKLRKNGFAFTIDLLGEASVNEEESDAYAAGYHEVLDALADAQKKWTPLPGGSGAGDLDWGSMPKVNISIKPSALYYQAKPVSQEDSITSIYRRIVPLYKKVIDMGGFMCIDILLFDEVIGHMRERLEIPEAGVIPVTERLYTDLDGDTDYHPYLPREDGRLPMSNFGGVHRFNVTGLFHDIRGFPTLNDAQVNKLVHHLCDKIESNAHEIARWKEFYLDDAEQVLISYGSSARSARHIVEGRRKKGHKLGLLELQTLWPFPSALVREKTRNAKNIFVVEMNMGQITAQVKLAVDSPLRVYLVNRMDGHLITPSEIGSVMRVIEGEGM